MNNNWTLLLVGAAACLASMIVAPVVRALALRFDITDRPDGHRKMQKRPVPLGGGVNVFLGLWLTIAVALVVSNHWQSDLRSGVGNLGALFLSSLAITVLGLVDDRFGLRCRHKLAGQVLASLVLIASGLVIHNVVLFGVDIDLGPLAIPATLMWLVLAINALNLIDGVDGLATSVGVVLSATIAVVAILTGHNSEAAVMAALAGSLLGFLRYNFPPAKMYLGDAGSMLIGLMIGALAIRGSLKGPATVALAAPLAVFTIPLFDTMAAILRRKLTGRSIYMGDRAHIHHCVMARSGSGARTVYWIALACCATSVGALFSVFLKSDAIAALTALSVIGVLVATRVFGYVELILLSSRLKNFGLSLITPARPMPPEGRHSAIRLQGNRPWDLLWKSLIEVIHKFNLHSIRLDVNVPAFQESYYASWASRNRRDANHLWRTEIPLFVGENVVGRLTITGDASSHECLSVCESIERLMDLLHPFELRLLELATQEDGQLAAVKLADREPGSGEGAPDANDSGEIAVGELSADEPSHAASL